MTLVNDYEIPWAALANPFQIISEDSLVNASDDHAVCL
jgi:hypothetical protein